VADGTVGDEALMRPGVGIAKGMYPEVLECEDYGHFPDELPASSEHLMIVFRAATASVTQRWKNKNLSADFVADYFANFFPGPESQRQEEVRSAIGFVANELLENALKFNHDPAYDMSIELHLYPDSLILLSTNSTSPSEVPALQAYLRELLTEDPGELYIRQLEKNAAEDSASSRLGFLTMLTDYGAQLSWRFERIMIGGPEPTLVLTTLVTLTV
jgi:hypothetical protein